MQANYIVIAKINTLERFVSVMWPQAQIKFKRKVEVQSKISHEQTETMHNNQMPKPHASCCREGKINYFQVRLLWVCNGWLLGVFLAFDLPTVQAGNDKECPADPETMKPRQTKNVLKQETQANNNTSKPVRAPSHWGLLS